jgi:hypothetical protein
MSNLGLNLSGLTPLRATIPTVETRLSISDNWGNIKVRSAFGRKSYTVKPGLYAVGKPKTSSDVFVTANYKLSFDVLRKNLDGLDAWILVLDTQGVNVWCAAGKSTFGTKELVKRINNTGLKNIVNHRRLIVPQLGAPGIAAHLVKQYSEFSVIFGPVRASDIKKFIENGYKSTTEMRTVTFNLVDRVKLIPVEAVLNFKYLFSAIAVLSLLSGLSRAGFSLNAAINEGARNSGFIVLSYICGVIFTPILLPYIPFRSFSMKGAFIGFLAFSMLVILNVNLGGIVGTTSWFFMGTAIASFLAMNFTGTSNYTSLSGVLKEMKYAVPLQIIAATVGLILFIIEKFI